jgi:hypothetical protein
MRMRMRVFFFLLSNRFANTVETFTSQTHFCCFLPNFIILFLKPLLCFVITIIRSPYE